MKGFGSQLLQALNGDRSEAPAKGFLTSKEWAWKWGFSLSHTMSVIQKLVRKGKMERRVYRIFNATRQFPTPHYKLK